MTCELTCLNSCLQLEMCWFILTLNCFVLTPIVFPIYMFLFRYTFYISDDIWHWLSGSQFLCRFIKFDHLTLKTNLIKLIFFNHVHGFLMFLRFDMGLEDANSLYRFFSCFRGSIKASYIDLTWSFLMFLIGCDKRNNIFLFVLNLEVLHWKYFYLLDVLVNSSKRIIIITGFYRKSIILFARL